MMDVSAEGLNHLGIPERRERQKQEQRQRILDAALAIITQEGFAALSMRKLADRIEYSPASIYLHFESREQIAKELSEVAFENLLHALSAAISKPNAIEALHVMGAAYVSYGIKNPEMYRLIFMGDSDYMTAAFGTQTEDSAGIRAYATLLDLAARLQSSILTKRSATVELAELIWMTLHGIVSLHLVCVGIQLTSPKKLARLATETIAAGLGHTAAKRTSQSSARR